MFLEAISCFASFLYLKDNTKISVLQDGKLSESNNEMLEKKRIDWENGLCYTKNVGWPVGCPILQSGGEIMKVLCYGDSNTYGFDPRGIFADRYDENWCDLLAQKTDWEVINGGSNGRSLPGSTRWIDSYLRKYEGIDRVLIMMGTNDILQERPTTRIVKDMDTLLEHLQTAWPEVEVVLLSPPPIAIWGESFDDQLAEVIEGYQWLVEKWKIKFVDTTKWGLSMAFDGVHLSEAGHRMFAEKLYRLIII